MGVPTVMGVEELPIELLNGAPLIVDGFAGAVISYLRKKREALLRSSGSGRTGVGRRF